jgi:hypothetical protein
LLDKAEIDCCLFSSIFSIIGYLCIFIKKIIESFHPLYKFEIILIFTFRQFLNIDIFLDFTFNKGLLKYFKIIDKFPLIFSRPVDTLHMNTTWEHGIDDLTIDGTGS